MTGVTIEKRRRRRRSAERTPNLIDDASHGTGASRRGLLTGLLMITTPTMGTRAEGMTLADAPISMTGDWGGSLPQAALKVVERMRRASLAGVRLPSDQQPARIAVANQTSGPPHIWRHFDDEPVAMIVVDIGTRDWCKLAYQFGHEFGHVLANSWRRDARPMPGSQWLEEALVEAFSLRGLGLLATQWQADPPFPGDAAFSGAIRRYRDDQLAVYERYAMEQGIAENAHAWFLSQREALEHAVGLTALCEALVPVIVTAFGSDPVRVSDLGMLNLWPERSALALEPYLDQWQQRCQAMGTPGWMPRRLRQMLLGV